MTARSSPARTVALKRPRSCATTALRLPRQMRTRQSRPLGSCPSPPPAPPRRQSDLPGCRPGARAGRKVSSRSAGGPADPACGSPRCRSPAVHSAGRSPLRHLVTRPLVRAVGTAVHVDAVGRVHDAVEDRLGDDRIGEERIPVARLPVRRQDEGLCGPLGDELVEVGAGQRATRAIAPWSAWRNATATAEAAHWQSPWGSTIVP